MLIAELARTTGTEPRQVRWLIAEGIVPQVKAVLRERAREAAGLELRLAPGITLRVEPEALGTLDPDGIGRRVAEELERAMATKAGGPDDAA